MDIIRVKNILKQAAKSQFGEIICNEVSPHKQRNIGLGIETDNDAVTFISNKRTECQTLETEIDTLTNTDIIDNFNTDSDENMKTYVDTYLPNLTTSDQKIAIIIGIQEAQREIQIEESMEEQPEI